MINKKIRSNLVLASLAFATGTLFSMSLDAAVSKHAQRRDEVSIEAQVNASTDNLEEDQSLYDIATEELQDILDQAEQNPTIAAIGDAGESVMNKLELTLAYLKAKGHDVTDAVVQHVTNNKGGYLTLTLLGTGIVIGWSLSRHCCRSSD